MHCSLRQGCLCLVLCGWSNLFPYLSQIIFPTAGLGSCVWFLKGDFLCKEGGWEHHGEKSRGGGAHLVPSCLQSTPGVLHCPPHAGRQWEVAVGVVVPNPQGSGAGVHLEQSDTSLAFLFLMGLL